MLDQRDRRRSVTHRDALAVVLALLVGLTAGRAVATLAGDPAVGIGLGVGAGIGFAVVLVRALRAGEAG